jgi:molecular chaperone HtpG
VNGIVEELVHQFTDPFAFYRELIQNSIDAGSTRIEVTLAYRPAAKGGLLVVSVCDWGEGMNRDVIENYLVTKFRSTKENDLTKIGKFGIGFVSIFACKPDVVTVDTGRDGEFWRVLFRADTTWELLKLPEPLEGTRVTLHKAMGPHDYDQFVEKSKASILRWCRHSDVDVTFSAGGTDGSAPPTPTPVREPLSVDAPFQVEHVEDGTHIIAGPSRVEPPVTGMYNRGLTLLETTEPLEPGVTMKIVSRYFEHTLTRDNVRRDRHFSRAMGLARELVNGKLLEQLPAELSLAAEKKQGSADFQTLFLFAVTRLKPKQLSYRLCGGGSVSHEALAKTVADFGFLTLSPSRTPLVDRLIAAKLPVLDLHWGNELATAIASVLKVKRTVVADEHFTYAAPPDAPTPPEFSAALVALLREAGAAVGQVEVSEVRGAAAKQPFVLLDALSRPVPDEVATGSPFTRRTPSLLCFNLGHEAIAKAAPLFSRAPRLAAVLMARLVLVKSSRLDAARDAALTRWALT